MLRLLSRVISIVLVASMILVAVPEQANTQPADPAPEDVVAFLGRMTSAPEWPTVLANLGQLQMSMKVDEIELVHTSMEGIPVLAAKVPLEGDTAPVNFLQVVECEGSWLFHWIKAYEDASLRVILEGMDLSTGYSGITMLYQVQPEPVDPGMTLPVEPVEQPDVFICDFSCFTVPIVVCLWVCDSSWGQWQEACGAICSVVTWVVLCKIICRLGDGNA